MAGVAGGLPRTGIAGDLTMAGITGVLLTLSVAGAGVRTRRLIALSLASTKTSGLTALSFAGAAR